MDRGVVAIGTSEEFRKADGRDGARSDKNEMITRWSAPEGPQTISPDHPFLRALGINPPMSLEIIMDKNVKFTFARNAYLYCMSDEITDDLKRRMSKDFEADACVVVNDPSALLEAFKSHPFLRERQMRAASVAYVPSKEVKEFKGNDLFAKESDFSWQREFRIVWDGQVTDIKPILEIPEIIPILSRLY